MVRGLNTLMLEAQKNLDSKELLFVPPETVFWESGYHSIKKRTPHLISELKNSGIINERDLYHELGDE